MNFTQAMQLLSHGIKVTRLGWHEAMYIQKEEQHDSLSPYKIKTCVKAISRYDWSIDMLLSIDWIIDDDSIKTVTFAEAVEALKEGSRVRLSGWKKMYLQFDTQIRDVVLHHWVYHEYNPTFQDFCEEDWEQL